MTRTSLRRPESTPRSRLHKAAGAVAVAGVVVLIGVALRNALQGMSDANDDRVRELRSHDVLEPPPDYGPPATFEEKLVHWMQMLTTGDREDAEWALAQIEMESSRARPALVDAAQRSANSNYALVEQVLDYLLAHPGRDGLRLAREGLSSRDPGVVTRSAALLALLGGPEALDAADALAQAAITREHPVPLRCLDALSALGGPVCARAAMDAALRVDSGYRPHALYSLAAYGRELTGAFLEERFRTETESMSRLGAAQALVLQGNPLPVPWLRECLDRGGLGQNEYESALRILAEGRDERALAEIRELLAQPLDGARRESLVRMLEPYPLQLKEEALRETAAPGNVVEVRVTAWEALVRSGIPGAYEGLVRLLDMPGAEGADDRRVALLTIGRLRAVEAGPRLVAAWRAAGKRKEGAGLELRAMVLVGDPASADLVAGAMADDRSSHGQGGDAFNVHQILGDVSPDFCRALGRAIDQVLRRRGPTLSGSGLVHLIASAGICCDASTADAIEPFLFSEDVQVQLAAVRALSQIPGPGTEDALRRAWRRQHDLGLEYIRGALQRIHYRAVPGER